MSPAYSQLLSVQYSHSFTTLMCHCVVICLSVCLLLTTTLFRSVSLLWCLSVCPLTASFFLSVSLLWCLCVPYSQFLPASQSISQSVSLLWCLCVRYSHLLSTPTCSWHCRTCIGRSEVSFFIFNWISSRRATKYCWCQLKSLILVELTSAGIHSTPCVLQRAEFTTEFHEASCKMGTGSFPGVKCGRGVLLTTHPLLVLLSWKSRAIPLPTLWATPAL